MPDVHRGQRILAVDDLIVHATTVLQRSTVSYLASDLFDLHPGEALAGAWIWEGCVEITYHSSHEGDADPEIASIDLRGEWRRCDLTDWILAFPERQTNRLQRELLAGLIDSKHVLDLYRNAEISEGQACFILGLSRVEFRELEASDVL